MGGFFFFLTLVFVGDEVGLIDSWEWFGSECTSLNFYEIAIGMSCLL